MSRCRALYLSLLNFIMFLLAHSSSLSRSLCKMALLSDMFTSPPILCHQQTWWGCFQSHHPDHLWRCWISWGPVLVPGGSCMWLPVNLNKNCWLKPSGCSLWANFLLLFQTTNPIYIIPVCPGEGCGKQCWALCWRPGKQYPLLSPCNQIMLFCCRRWSD